MTHLSTTGSSIFIGLLIGFVLLILAVGRIAGRRVDTADDYLMAGRSVPLGLSILALLATWFGSSAILGATRNAYEFGLSGTVLEPFACAATLILTGWCFAERLWKSQVQTVADLFRNHFGHASEWLSCAIQVPTFFCWIGAQYLSIGAILETYLGLPGWIGVAAACLVVLVIIWGGGMWAVTWTSSIMVVLSIASVVLLWIATAHTLGDGDVVFGVQTVLSNTPASQLHFLPDRNPVAILAVFGIFLTGLLGNIPGQDLQQRVLCAHNPKVAKWACIFSGILYLLIGLIPIYIGLAARWQLSDVITPEDVAADRVLPIAAAHFMSEPMVIVLVIGLLAVNLAVAASSTLSQTTILASNIFSRWNRHAQGQPWMERACLIGVTAGSLIAAFSGESVMGLLEISLAIVMVSLFVPMCHCLFGSPSSPWSGLAPMIAGATAWGIHVFLSKTQEASVGLQASNLVWVWYMAIPSELQGLAASLVAAAVVHWMQPKPAA